MEQICKNKLKICRRQIIENKYGNNAPTLFWEHVFSKFSDPWNRPNLGSRNRVRWIFCLRKVTFRIEKSNPMNMCWKKCRFYDWFAEKVCLLVENMFVCRKVRFWKWVYVFLFSWFENDENAIRKNIRNSKNTTRKQQENVNLTNRKQPQQNQKQP